MPWLLFWLYLPQHLSLNLATIFWFCSFGRARVILRAKWHALKGLPRILRERRRIQARRLVNAWALRPAMAKGLLTPYVGRVKRLVHAKLTFDLPSLDELARRSAHAHRFRRLRSDTLGRSPPNAQRRPALSMLEKPKYSNDLAADRRKHFSRG